MRALVSAWTLVAMSLLFCAVATFNKDVALDALPSFLFVVVVIFATHVFYSRRERDPHA